MRDSSYKEYKEQHAQCMTSLLSPSQDRLHTAPTICKQHLATEWPYFIPPRYGVIPKNCGLEEAMLCLSRKTDPRRHNQGNVKEAQLPAFFLPLSSSSSLSGKW
jgi:hypothetical protein